MTGRTLDAARDTASGEDLATRAATTDCEATCAALSRDVAALWRGHRLAGAVAAGLTLLFGLLIGMAAGFTAAGLHAPLPLGRGLAVVLTVTGALAGAALAVRSRWPTSMARWAAGRVGPGRGEALQTAIELAAVRLRPDTTAPQESALLTASTVRNARPLLAELDADLGRARARNLRLALAMLALASALFGSTRLQPELWRRWVAGEAKRPRPPLSVGTLVGDQRLHIDPPGYAALSVAPREVDGAPGEVLRGSIIRASARPLRPFVSLHVELRSANTTRILPLQSGDREVHWRFEARDNATWRYVATDAAGLQHVERGWRPLTVRPDAPPSAELAAPEGEVEVRGGQQVMLTGAAQDDIGLARVELVVALPGGAQVRRPVAFASQEQRAEVRETIEIDKLKLRAGEFATLFLEVTDVGPERGRTVTSQRMLLRMFSPELHHGRVMDALAELTLLWTARLADRLERDPARQDTTLADALKNRLAFVAAETVGLQALDAVLVRLHEDVQSRAATSADAQEIGELLRDRLAEEERSVQRMSEQAAGLRAARHLAAARRAHTRIVAAQERAVVLLAALAAAEHRQAVIHQSKTLERIEQELQHALQKLADGKQRDGADAERLLDAVQAQVERMLASLAKQLPLAPAEHANPGGSVAQGVHGALGAHGDQLAKIRELVRQGRHADALAALKKLRAGLGDALEQLRQQAQREQTGEEASLRRLIGELAGGIERARTEEAGVREAARPPSEQQRRNLAQHLEVAARDVLPQVQALLNDAADQVRPRRLTSARARANRSIGQARAALATARAALDTAELDGALLGLSEADEQLAAAQREMAPTIEIGAVQAELHAADQGRIRNAADRVGRAAALLRDALPSPSALLDPGERRRLRDLEPRQRGVRRRLQRVRQRLARDAAAHPALQSQLGGRLDHALAVMQQAEASMRSGDATAAMEQASEADTALQKAARMLSDPERRPAPGSATGVGFSPPPQRIEIDPGHRDGRRAGYRQALLKAMGQQAPPVYRERVRRYYEAISR